MDTPPWRLPVLDTLRGYALIQVLLSTWLAAFCPGTVPPVPLDSDKITMILLAIASDGYAGICLFLCVTGYVLTWTYAPQPIPVPRLLLARTIRLVIPSLVALLFAAVIALFFANATHQAGNWNGSDLLRALYPSPPTAHALAKDAAAAMLTGYNGSSIVADFVTTWLHIRLPLVESVNPALWTLSLQLLGSALVIYLIAAAQIGTLAWFGLAALVVAGVLTTPLIGMFIGHKLALLALRRSDAMPIALSLPLFLAGGYLILVPFDGLAPDFEALIAALPYYRFTAAPHITHLSKIAGTSLAFIAVMTSPPLQRFLTISTVSWLGRFSFPIYLVHIPVICGLVPAVLIATDLHSGPARSLLILMTATAGLVLAATALNFVDWAARTTSQAVQGTRQDRNRSRSFGSESPTAPRPVPGGNRS